MPTRTYNDARGHARSHKARPDSGGEQANSIQGWTHGVDQAMQDMPLASSKHSGKQPASSASCSDARFDTLMSEYAEVREKMGRMEDKIAEFYYERQRDGEIVSSAPPDAKTSASQEGPSDKVKSRLGKRRDSPSAFSDYDDYSHGEKAKDKVKNRKVKKPKTEEEKNRHINTVFIRESMYL